LLVFYVWMYYRQLPFNGKIRLLDVGSCYNPFQAFAEFCAVGIDICPAVNVCFLLYVHINTVSVLNIITGIFVYIFVHFWSSVANLS